MNDETSEARGTYQFKRNGVAYHMEVSMTQTDADKLVAAMMGARWDSATRYTAERVA